MLHEIDEDDQLAGFQIDVVFAYEVHTQTETYAEYVIEIKSGASGGHPYCVARRYKEFLELHNTLRRRYPSLAFPAFPPKTLFRPSADDIEKRRKMFADYVAFIQWAQGLHADPAVKEFFVTNVVGDQLRQLGRGGRFANEDEAGVAADRRKRAVMRFASYAISILPVINLKEHLARLDRVVDATNGIDGYDQEFLFVETRSLQPQLHVSFAAALQPVNLAKNRYADVLPPDKTRVKLRGDPGVPGSDYINACFVRGVVGNEAAYICAQAPLPETVVQFWQMVWAYNVSVIVALTDEIEAGQLRCHRYWTDAEQPVEFGSLVVSAEEVSAAAQLTVRRLRLHDTSVGGPGRLVTQLHFRGWPDRGVPTDVGSFLDLIDQANDLNVSRAPLLVHCSAGVGRTGVFVTVRNCLERYRHDVAARPEVVPAFNLPDTIVRLRRDRPGLVQTKEQYRFCYSAILDGLERCKRRSAERLPT